MLIYLHLSLHLIFTKLELFTKVSLFHRDGQNTLSKYGILSSGLLKACEENNLLSLSKYFIYKSRKQYFDSDKKLISSQNLYFHMTVIFST